MVCLDSWTSIANRLVNAIHLNTHKFPFNSLVRHAPSGKITSSSSGPDVLRRKRKFEDVFAHAPAIIPIVNPARDAIYYDERTYGGFCVFLVENTLFRVHRLTLSRDSSTFEGMFSLPVQASVEEGSCDANPVLLSDTAEHFRALLWVLHALPPELQLNQNISSLPPIHRLLAIAEITNKYNFVSFESWALSALLRCAEDRAGPFRTASLDICVRMLDIAITCAHIPLRNIALNRVLTRILWNRVPLASAPAIAHKHSLRRLQGAVYYRQLVDAVHPTDPPPAFLSAHDSLASLWEHICTHPPPLRPDGCQEHARCVAAWREQWAAVGTTRRYGQADVLGRLGSMRERIRMLARERRISVSCALAAYEVLGRTIDSVSHGLIGHFVSEEGGL